MLNDKTIQTIAEAILANAKVLQSLVDSLPREAVVAIAAETKIEQSTPAPVVAQAPAPVVQQHAPVAAPVAQMPAMPVFETPAPVAAPAVAAAEVPYNDTQSMTQYVLSVYREIGPQRASGIQAVLTQLGVVNINDVKPEQYPQLFVGIEAVRKGQ